MERRWRLVRRLLEERGLDALLVYGAGRYQADVHWLTDWPGGREAYVLFPARGEATLLLQFYNHLPTARTLSQIGDVRWAGPVNPRSVAALLREKGLERARVGIAGALPWDQYRALAAELPEVRWEDARTAYQALRLRKSEEELARFRYAARLADEAMRALESGLAPGLAQDRIAALVERPMLEGGGYAGIHYVGVMPMEGPFLAVPAQYNLHVPLREGDVVITEITACFAGYQGQIHRTYSLRRPPDARWRHLHDVALEALEGILAAARPGAPVEALMEAGEVIHRHGYTIVDDLVHGADQLPPVLRTRRTVHQPYPQGMRLEEGMVLVIQPNVVDPRSGRGLQLGETVLVAGSGAVTLHAYPRRWVVCS
ncbi:MAG: M24 family metallopeptidase [Bacillota bacterium]|nr:M24 family metallopeptidase [Bacillota bacterium]